MSARRLTILLVLCVLCVFCLTQSLNVQPKNYTINLDLQPNKRWSALVTEYKAYVQEFARQEIILSGINGRELIEVLSYAEELNKIMPEEYGEEIRGMADAAEMSIGEMMLVNIIYELSVHCTSIVAQNSAGKIIHGRNLDYGMTQALKNLTVHLNYQKKGITIYSSTSFVGFNAIWTGQKPYSFTISGNQRVTKQGSIKENILQILLNKDTKFIGLEMRKVLETARNFAEAEQILSSTPIITPVYIILGGVKQGEGVVITRDRTGAVNRNRLDIKSGKWFVLETNYDPWTTPPPNDDRRDPGIKLMNQVGQDDMTATTLNDRVLSIEPVCNMLTSYTVTMSANFPNTYHSVIREGDTKCKSGN